MFDLVAIGAANVDMLFYVDDFPKPDQETAVNNFELRSGGSAANVAVGLSRLGKKSSFVGKVGNDYFGKLLISDFQKDNVDISNLKIDNGSSGLVTAVVDKNGQRILLVNQGVQSTLSKDDISEGMIKNSKFLFIHSVAGKNVIGCLETAVEYAKRNGVKVVFDPGFMFAEMGIEKFKKILASTNVLKLNSEEQKVFTNTESLDDGFKVIGNYGSEISVVTMGKYGSAVSFENRITKIPIEGFDVKVVDTTGAGDAFSSALISSMVDGKNIYEACKFANIVGRISITKVGARCVPTLEELKEFGV